MKSKKQIVIRGKPLFDGKRFLDDRRIVVEHNTIVDVVKGSGKADYEGIVTPAFIDAHSHIGMFRHGEPGDISEGNDRFSHIRPLHDPLNALYFDDQAFAEAIRFGNLYSCILPGSGNLFGGRSKVIRNFAGHVDQALFYDFGFKMALGFNPISPGVQGWKGDRPNTRMGAYALLEGEFDEVLRKKKRLDLLLEKEEGEIRSSDLSDTEKSLRTENARARFSCELSEHEKALLELLVEKRPVKVHVHKEDDVIYLLHLKKKYDLKVSAEHTGDVHTTSIFKKLKADGVPVVLGPLGSHAYKLELRHQHYSNVEKAIKAGVEMGLMTDHPVIHASGLRESLKYFLIAGMSEEDALSLITYQNAKRLSVDDQLGTLETGKLASVLVWNMNPLHLASFPSLVMAEGKILH